jgi:hypothetical protein
MVGCIILHGDLITCAYYNEDAKVNIFWEL